MNKIYRTVYNETTNTWVAVAEISTAKGKSNSRDVVATAVESAESSIFRFSPRSLLMAIVGAFALLSGQTYAATGATVTTMVAEPPKMHRLLSVLVQLRLM